MLKQHILHNNFLTVTVKLAPFEIGSIVAFDKEYVYQRNNNWQKSWPLCFPWVGRLKNGTYNYKGKTFHMNRHGFIQKIKNWKVVKATKNQIIVSFSGDDFIDQYPFRFKLTLIVKIKNNSVYYFVIVKNKSKEEMFYGFGFHPGFLLHANQTKINLSRKCKLMQVPEHGFFESKLDQTLITTFNGEKFNFSKGSTFVAWSSNLEDIVVNDGKNKFNMSFEPAPMLAIWTEDANKDFLCIEPWYSQPDYTKNGDVPLEKKPGVLSLPKKGSKKYYLSINIIS